MNQSIERISAVLNEVGAWGAISEGVSLNQAAPSAITA